MSRTVVVIVALLGALSLATGDARAVGCGLGDARPLWIDYAEGAVPFRDALFGQPGMVVATSGPRVSGALREAGAKTIFWEMNLRKHVGTTSNPTDPPVVEVQAQKLFDRAARESACATPQIVLNELQGAGTTTPWSTTNAQYRANVLALLRGLATRGAHAFLLVSSVPYTGGDAADWWRAVAQVADVVPEVYFNAPRNMAPGPLLASRRARIAMRDAIASYTALGIAPARLGIMLGFQTESANGGREGLDRPAWFEYVKLQTLAATQVAAETGIATIWSWGWGVFGASSDDPDKATAACVYLWTRNHGFCDAPTEAAVDFDPSLTEGQIALPADAQCTVGTETLSQREIAALSQVTHDRQVAETILLARLAEEGRVTVEQSELLAAERTLIFQHFGGSRAAYTAALARAGAGLEVARGAIGDQLRRGRIEATLAVRGASDVDVTEFYRNYPAVPVRPVEADPAPTWLGGKLQGLAISSLAPPQVFGIRPLRKATVHTAEGTFAVRALGDALPLGAYPIAAVRQAIAATLAGYAREAAFDAWSVARQKRVLNVATCVGDDLPQVASVELTTYLTFLMLR